METTKTAPQTEPANMSGYYNELSRHVDQCQKALPKVQNEVAKGAIKLHLILTQAMMSLVMDLIKEHGDMEYTAYFERGEIIPAKTNLHLNS